MLIAIAVLVLLAGASLALTSGGTGGEGAALSPPEDNTPPPGWIMIANTISSDPSTWPSGSVIWNICRAIAFAEGANVSGSVPDRLNNPGDISDGGSIYPQEYHSGSSVTVFPDKATGWQWLYDKIENAITGNSNVYKPTMTWRQISQLWAGNSTAWLNNVTSFLGVSPDSTLQDYAG